MKMNELINKISELFKEDNSVTIYCYDRKIGIYGICFSNMEIRKIWRIIQQERILIEINANTNKKVCIKLILEEEE